MTKFESTLNLPTEDLKERRSILEAELKKAIVEIVVSELKEKLATPLKDAGIGELTKITWEFHGEYDDEGGTAYYPQGIELYNNDGEIDSEDLEDVIVLKKYTYSDSVYEYDVDEFVTDVLHEFSDELYQYDIEEIIF